MGKGREREQAAGEGGVSEETGRGTGGSKLRKTNRAKLKESCTGNQQVPWS